jgi:gas vesicle protein
MKVRRGNGMKTGYVVRGAGVALAAGVVGAGVALLFAPYSGLRTRRWIRRKAEDVGYSVREAYERLRENGNGAARTLAYRWRMKLTPRSATERVVRS